MAEFGFKSWPSGPRVHTLDHHILVQGSTNHGLWVKSGPLAAFINKALLVHTHSFMYCLWLFLCYNDKVEELQQRPYGPQNPKCLQEKLILYLVLLRKLLLIESCCFVLFTWSGELLALHISPTEVSEKTNWGKKFSFL